MTDNIKKEKNSKSKKIIIIIGAVLLIAVVIASAFLIKSHNDSLHTNGTEDFVISTPVGDLKYPGELSENVKLKVNSDKNPYSATLYGIAGKAEAELFTINVGDDGQGYLFGTVPDENGNTVEIRININGIPQLDGCSEEDIQQLYSMQDRVNDIIEQIYALDGFESVNNDEY